MISNKKLDKASAVYEYWNKESCGTDITRKEKYTLEYFDDIEEHRYKVEPEIFSFAQFSRYNRKKILEVGVGAGTDFLQFARSGAECFGIDLTNEAVINVEKRFNLYDHKYKYLKVVNSEKLPFESNSFDLVYSWGVIHHSPNMENALREIIRVCKVGGECKIMVYNKYSLVALYLWFKYCFLRLDFFKTLSYAVFNFMESPGTKCYTDKEISDIIRKYSTKSIEINNVFTHYDKKEHLKGLKLISILMYKIFGNRIGWFKTIKFIKYSDV